MLKPVGKNFLVDERREEAWRVFFQPRVWMGRVGMVAGTVAWFEPWRRYTFNPAVNMRFDTEMLVEIAGFLEALKLEEQR